LPGRGLPLSMAACATQFVIDCAEQPNSRDSSAGYDPLVPAQSSVGEIPPDTARVMSASWTPSSPRIRCPRKRGNSNSTATNRGNSLGSPDASRQASCPAMISVS
jgi:hypothetical protein